MAFSSNDPRNYLGVGKQADFDTEATSFKFVKFLGDSGISIELDAESVFEGGDGQDHGLHYRSRTRADGQIVSYVRPDTWTWAAAYAMGSAAAIPSVADTNVASHIYVPNATVPFLTIEQAWAGGNQIERARSAIFTGFQVEGGAGEPWRLTLPFVGGGTPYWRDGAASALSPALESGDPAMYAGGAYLINGATTLDIRRFNVNFARQVDSDLYTTQTFRRKVVPLTRTVEVTFQTIFQDADLYRQIQYGAAAATVVPQSLASGAFHARRNLVSSQMVSIDVPLLDFTAVDVNRLEPDGETVVLDVSAMGVKGATGVIQLRGNITGRATSYLA